MKKYILASVALALSLGVAHAGDSKFDGVYGGVEANYGKAKNSDIDTDGFGGGAFGGYGRTFGNWYVGGELNADFSKADGSQGGIKLEKKYSYGVAARAGYLLNETTMGYGLVGWERGKFKARDSEVEVSGELNGIRVGLGVETFVKKNISLRGEVNYVDWQDHDGFGGGHEYRANVGVAYHF
jgi:outer membrane immunogenic protein